MNKNNKICKAFLITSLMAGSITTQASNEAQVILSPLPTFKTEDGRFSAKIIGFAQADAAFHDDDNLDHPNGTSIRRARLGIKGSINGLWGYKLLHDFGNNGDPALQDMFISYKPNKNKQIKLGQFKETIGLEWQSAAKNWTFMELPLTAALTPRRAIGANYTVNQQHWRYSVGLFGEATQQSRADEEASSLDLHSRYLLNNGNNNYAHIGLSLSYRLPNNETDSISVKAKQETATVKVPTINSGTIGEVDNSIIFGIEGLWIQKRLMLQAEAVQLGINRDGLDNITVTSFYLQSSYMLTSDKRAFDAASHGFKTVKPENPYSQQGDGAWEVAFRYESLDANDQDIEFGKLEKFVVGINWYLDAYVRFTVDLTSSKSDENAAIPNDNTNTLSLRAQIGF